MSGCSVEPVSVQTPEGIWLTEAEVNFITGLLVELPFKVAAPIVHLLATKLMEARNGDN
jgi:hypothetical protein